MRTTVYFATNRQEDQQATDPGLRFTAAMAPPGEGRLRWGQAFVEDTDPDPAVLRTGRIASIEGVTGDLFPKAMQDDILGSGKNLLFFVHGFANSFADGIARAAFNREWFAAADCTVITFTWPSPGLIVDQKDVVPGAVVSLFSLLGFTLSGHLRNPLVDRYLDDQAAARNSGTDFASVLDRLAPLSAKPGGVAARSSCWRTAWGTSCCRARLIPSASPARRRPRPISTTPCWRRPMPMRRWPGGRRPGCPACPPGRTPPASITAMPTRSSG